VRRSASNRREPVRFEAEGTGAVRARIFAAMTRRRQQSTSWWRRHGDVAVLGLAAAVIVFTGISPPAG
jgi:hypothetical protein